MAKFYYSGIRQACWLRVSIELSEVVNASNGATGAPRWSDPAVTERLLRRLFAVLRPS
jgi:hypothetical protein